MAIFYAGLSGALSLLVTFICARIMGAYDYSWIVLGIAIGSIIIPIINLGSDRTLIRDLTYLKSDTDRSIFITKNTSFRLMTFLSISLLSSIIIYYIIDSPLPFKFSLWCIILWTLLQGCYPFSLFDFVGMTNLQNRLTVFERLTAVIIVTVLAISLFNSQLLLVISITLLITRLISIISQYKAWNSLNKSISFQSSQLFSKIDLSSVNIRITLIQFSSGLILYANQIFLKSSNQLSSLAAYGLICQVLNIVLVFQGQSLRLFSRQISESCRHPSPNTLRLLLRHLLAMLFISIAFSMASWILIQIISHFLSTKNFSDITLLATPMCLWAALTGIGLVSSQYLIGMRFDTAYSRINIIGGFVSLVSGFYLVPTHGAIMAAYLLLTIHGTMIMAQLFFVFFALNQHLNNNIESSQKGSPND
ncbi:O-antigen/teichoic acid export membrane protein [Fluviicoccus keumensis]|uniref:O-antigen/teichoic acid export membrane protein n=1 Tax=Fluviicoccus keumensis TaxID=1435465 RepID=A0A4Q7Z9U7_9GAMM|nr:hypothetical protein [Fluviicoccus keumensis]RZU46841.1 O-antigen/teichoic acid export membrane protein [Fluviicoccus keumensis]